MLGASLLLLSASARFLTLSRDINDFESLNPGTKEYFASLEKLFVHPWRKTDYRTFEEALKDWYTHMINSNCGGLPSSAGRKKELTNKCQSSKHDSLNVWKLFTQDEVTWFKKNYPADEKDHFGAGFRQIHDTVKKLLRKELLCVTLFTIDDNCVDSKYVRLG